MRRVTGHLFVSDGMNILLNEAFSYQRVSAPRIYMEFSLEFSVRANSTLLPFNAEEFTSGCNVNGNADSNEILQSDNANWVRIFNKYVKLTGQIYSLRLDDASCHK
ncbi:uncharacterized protein LOC107268956 [Cephus cinctus]|uniref:Uncharacterized protein LOC107268956 n=1 Tax=Cephus cinctus TaxID=211228 RepID=A0AAJ7FLJ3_CEPCN|nr:uncharacterized protein LOC107268956 [Cephus cinctus]